MVLEVEVRHHATSTPLPVHRLHVYTPGIPSVDVDSRATFDAYFKVKIRYNGAGTRTGNAIILLHPSCCIWQGWHVFVSHTTRLVVAKSPFSTFASNDDA